MLRMITAIAVLVSMGFGSFCYADEGTSDWALTLYGGRLSADTLGDTLTFQADYEDSYFGVLAVSRRLATFREMIDLEAEGQIAQHFGDQDHLETNGLLVVRWLPFYWDDFVETSVAMGFGVSYAFETPEVEAIGVSDTPKTLGYLMIEFEFRPDEQAHWGVVARVHHRSGANGIFGGRLDASNGWCLGVKYRF